MDISIIIVNYNTSKLLKECILSVNEKTKNILYELIIVDNASSDDSVEMISTYFPDIILIKSNKNLGFGRANNLGAKYAKGEYLFFLNTDTLLINNAIKILFDFMEKEESKNIGACGGNLYKQDLSPNFSYSLNFPSLWSHFCYRSHLPIFKNNENFNESGMVKDVAIIIGADLFVRRNLFEKIGGFDPNFFMYIEDGELQYQIKKLNYRIVSVPTAKIIHLQGKSSNNMNRLKMEITSYHIFFKKYFSTLSLLLYKGIEVSSAITRAFIFLCMFELKKSKEYLSIVKFILKK